MYVVYWSWKISSLTKNPNYFCINYFCCFVIDYWFFTLMHFVFCFYSFGNQGSGFYHLDFKRRHRVMWRVMRIALPVSCPSLPPFQNTQSLSGLEHWVPSANFLHSPLRISTSPPTTLYTQAHTNTCYRVSNGIKPVLSTALKRSPLLCVCM